MKFHRRQFLHVSAGAFALPAVSRVAWALSYPSRPVRIIVGFAAGSGSDIVARLLGQWLSERLHQPFITENRPGAGGNLGAEAVVKATPDGHTLLLVATPNAINATLYDKLNFNFIQDIEPVASISREPNVIVVNPSVPARTVPEFIAYAKANPGKIAMASAGNGSSSHLAGALFQNMAGISMVHVPYRGAPPAITDLISGQAQFFAAPTSVLIEHIRAGKVRPLAVTTSQRSNALADIPTVAETMPGFEASTWFGLGAPKGTPAQIINRLNEETNAALADPKIKGRLADLGGTTLVGSPADFGKFIVDETEKWGQVIRAANIRVG
jgi:tripartite-type tricarboxylate transporter receptor subunit TctC